MKRQTALIVDDERLARRELRHLLADYNHIEITGEADSVDSAEALIKTTRPDLVFLDIQLMGETGFTLLNRFSDPDFKVVFITAYDEYAIKAFDVNAIDYLLKPVNPKRLKKTLERLDENKTDISSEEPRKLGYNEMIFYKLNSSFCCFRIDSIQSIHAQADYSHFYTSDQKKHLILKPLKHWEQNLPSEYFQRIHRSTIINIDCIQKIERGDNSNLLVYLTNDETAYPVSRTYTSALRKAIKQ
jgi:two-component system LytT family response regulator